MGIGFLEMLVIGGVALVLLGPQRLPEAMRHLAKFYVQMRRTSNDFKSAFDQVVREAEAEFQKEEVKRLQALLNQKVDPQQVLNLSATSDTKGHEESPGHYGHDYSGLVQDNYHQHLPHNEAGELLVDASKAPATRPEQPFAFEESKSTTARPEEPKA